MRLTKKKKQVLFDLLDVMTDGCPMNGLMRVVSNAYSKEYWNIFKKLRMDLKGF